MSFRGKNNGTFYFDCPFCGEKTGQTNLMGRTPIPRGFPEDERATPHTVKCWHDRRVSFLAGKLSSIDYTKIELERLELIWHTVEASRKVEP